MSSRLPIVIVTFLLGPSCAYTVTANNANYHKMRRAVSLPEVEPDPYFQIIETAANALPVDQFVNDNLLVQVIDNNGNEFETTYKVVNPGSKIKTKKEMNSTISTRNISAAHIDVVVIPISNQTSLRQSSRKCYLYIVLKEHPTAAERLYYFSYAYISRNETVVDQDVIKVGDLNVRIEWELHFEIDDEATAGLENGKLSNASEHYQAGIGRSLSLSEDRMNSTQFLGFVTHRGAKLIELVMGVKSPPISPKVLYSKYTKLQEMPPVFFGKDSSIILANKTEEQKHEVLGVPGNYSTLDYPNHQVHGILICHHGTFHTFVPDSSDTVFGFVLPARASTEGIFIDDKNKSITMEGTLFPGSVGFPAWFLRKNEGIPGIFKPLNGTPPFPGYYVLPGRFLPENPTVLNTLFSYDKPNIKVTFQPAMLEHKKELMGNITGKILRSEYINEPPIFVADSQGSFGTLMIALFPCTIMKGIILITGSFLPSDLKDLQILPVGLPVWAHWEPEDKDGPFHNQTEGLLYTLPGVGNPIFEPKSTSRSLYNNTTYNYSYYCDTENKKIPKTLPIIPNPTSAREQKSLTSSSCQEAKTFGIFMDENSKNPPILGDLEPQLNLKDVLPLYELHISNQAIIWRNMKFISGTFVPYVQAHCNPSQSLVPVHGKLIKNVDRSVKFMPDLEQPNAEERKSNPSKKRQIIEQISNPNSVANPFVELFPIIKELQSAISLIFKRKSSTTKEQKAEKSDASVESFNFNWWRDIFA